MQNLTMASRQLFGRSPDEMFDSLDDLYKKAAGDQQESEDRWYSPAELRPVARQCRLDLEVGVAAGVGAGAGAGAAEPHQLNDWSFSQLCKFAAVSKETVNKLSAETAARVLVETLPTGGKPIQVLTRRNVVRSVHGASYTRLANLDLLNIVREFATDFQPAQKSQFGGGSGLYCGEQDMFVFLIDPLGWAEIEGQAFAPGFFLWNSEVGRRSVGIQSFWFQAVCANHIVWDAVEVVDFSRKHTANVRQCLSEIRRHIEQLIEKRDRRRDGFARVMTSAFKTQLGGDAEAVARVLSSRGIPRDLGQRALKLAEESGRFTIFSIVDALTRLAGEYQYAGDRTELDQKAGSLLALADCVNV